MKKEKSIRLALVDDHVLFRQGLKDLLMNETDIDVVAEGNDGSDALGFASEKNLDVLLIDLRMPKLGGVSTIKRLRETYQDLKIIVITMYEDDDHKREAILAGADAYHSKMDNVQTIVQSIRQLMKGKKLIEDHVVNQLKKIQRDGLLMYEANSLTETEYKVLEELQKGRSNREMANSLAMSERTVKNHLVTIFKKLGAKSRLDAVVKGIEKKLLPVSL